MRHLCATGVTVNCPSHLFVPLSVHSPSLHLTSWTRPSPGHLCTVCNLSAAGCGRLLPLWIRCIGSVFLLPWSKPWSFILNCLILVLLLSVAHRASMWQTSGGGLSALWEVFVYWHSEASISYCRPRRNGYPRWVSDDWKDIFWPLNKLFS